MELLVKEKFFPENSNLPNLVYIISSKLSIIKDYFKIAVFFIDEH